MLGAATLGVNVVGDPRVRGDAARLVQVVINLVTNAAHAVLASPDTRRDVVIRAGVGADGRACLEIEDSGPGVTREIRDRMFQPFFTTKGSSGTGLGLAICHGIVAAHGGEITVESEGRGTIVRVLLPSAARAIRETVPAPGRSDARRRQRVLIVDDYGPVARATATLLADEHDVEHSVSSVAVLERVRAGADWDVILCDLSMPVLGGMGLYHEIERLRPALARAMIFMTGGTTVPEEHAFLEAPGRLVLEKPFGRPLLRAAIARALARTASR